MNLLGGDNLNIGIISAKTGQGHISVANSLKREFLNKGIHAETFESFYEDLMFSNKIISDYYNFLMTTSTELCCKFSELSYLTRPDLSEDFFKGVQQNIISFIKENSFDKIISTSHTINYAMIKVLKDLKLYEKIEYYIVITDPFFPISVGFDAYGATKYYCYGYNVADFLHKRKIDTDKIVQTAYPVHEKFLKQYLDEEIDEIYKKYGLSKNKKILLINSGSQGAYHYIKYLKTVLENIKDLQVIFISGKNESLYTMAIQASEKYKKRVRVFGYVKNIEDLLRISDFVLAKPGANTFFECIYMQKPLLIDGTNGFLFQEKGIVESLETNRLGVVINSYDELVNELKRLLLNKNYLELYTNLKSINIRSGASDIVEDILKG